jgi:protein-L-isoaspartate(D-aspartate) O-methyltransferase
MDFKTARQNMLDSQIKVNDVSDAWLQAAMAKIARERLCATDQAFAAYGEVEAEIAPGRHLMKPRDISKLLMALLPQKDEKILAIAAPYAAAVCADLGANVTAQENDARTQSVIEPYLKSLGVKLVLEDLNVASGKDYDAIIVEGSVTEVPQSWLKALKVGGRLALVVRTEAMGRARVYTRYENSFSFKDVFDSSPSLLPGFAKVATFVL